jgi:hypothetical protein
VQDVIKLLKTAFLLEDPTKFDSNKKDFRLLDIGNRKKHIEIKIWNTED